MDGGDRDGDGCVGFGVVGTHEKVARMMVKSGGCHAGVDGGVSMVPE